MENTTTKIAQKRQLLIEQKKQLILTDSSKAYWKFINAENHEIYDELMAMMERCLIDVTGYYQTKNSKIAQEHVLLTMLQKNLF